MLNMLVTGTFHIYLHPESNPNFMTTNRITLIGYVGTDLKITRSGNGSFRTALRVATHYRRAKYRDFVTVWHDVICWDSQADFANRNFVKGSKIFLEGTLEYREYADRKGHLRYHTQIKAHSLLNLDR